MLLNKNFYLKQPLLLGQFHIYGAVLVKNPTDEHARSHRKDLYSLDTPGSIIVRKIPFFYIHWVASFFTEIVKFHLAVSPPLLLLAICEVQHRVLPQAVPSERSKCLSDDKWLPYLALTVNLHVISRVSFPRRKTAFLEVTLHEGCCFFFQFVSEVVAGVKIHQVKRENLHSFVPFSSNYRNNGGRNILSQLKWKVKAKDLTR